MKERPILFSREMVRAILAGRKTVTRRVIKPQPYLCDGEWLTNYEDSVGDPLPVTDPRFLTKCPYGHPGNHLWVRETWFDNNAVPMGNGPQERKLEHVYYRADGEPDFEGESIQTDGGGWRPSIHMPRWASRITLEVVSVRVEQVQDISYQDARAEGCPFHPLDASPLASIDPQDWFRALWDSINGAKPGCSWEANPWVWVVEFRPVDGGRVK